MADLRGYVTAAGQQFESLAKQMKWPVEIGMIDIGDGVLPDSESPIGRTQLVNKICSFPAVIEQDAKNPGQWVAWIHIPPDHAINGQGYFIREMGCRLINKGDGILYAYRRVSNDWKPVDTSGEAKSFIYKLRFIPGNGELLSPTIDPSVVMVDREDLEREMKKHKESRDHPLATTKLPGLVRLATDEESLLGESVEAIMSAKNVSDAVKNMLKQMFVGIPLPWMSATPPTWGINMAGQNINPTTDPILASRYPSGIVPDHRAMTVRGWDNGRGIDVGRNMLSYQQDQQQPITGRLWTQGGVYQFLGEFVSAEGVFATNGNDKIEGIVDAGGAVGPSELTFNSARVVRTGSENTVKSLAYNIITMRG
ncbi:phage tail protein [Aeromonas veronii]|uniref:phage tail protein n=1 Tax=Aeromonas veronii TaxID=654 RepID=UPI0023646AE3|nr:phage tail protein [Aeromonas veronii]MDD1846568.1 phage tail protein [Aeromonas veronii]